MRQQRTGCVQVIERELTVLKWFPWVGWYVVSCPILDAAERASTPASGGFPTP
jgi:hypothetical protein